MGDPLVDAVENNRRLLGLPPSQPDGTWDHDVIVTSDSSMMRVQLVEAGRNGWRVVTAYPMGLFHVVLLERPHVPETWGEPAGEASWVTGGVKRPVGALTCDQAHPGQSIACVPPWHWPEQSVEVSLPTAADKLNLPEIDTITGQPLPPVTTVEKFGGPAGSVGD
jgi:hypothetical protein